MNFQAEYIKRGNEIFEKFNVNEKLLYINSENPYETVDCVINQVIQEDVLGDKGFCYEIIINGGKKATAMPDKLLRPGGGIPSNRNWTNGQEVIVLHENFPSLSGEREAAAGINIIKKLTKPDATPADVLRS